MLKSLAVALALLLIASGAEARHHPASPRGYAGHVRIHHAHHTARTIAADPGCNVIFPCAGVQLSARGQAIARGIGFGAALPVYVPTEVARPHRIHTRNFVAKPEFRPRIVADPTSPRGFVVASPRPADCRGIAWCGCWLRHHLGLADTRLNLAMAWMGVGRPTVAHAGAVVVWRHHVGLITSEPVNGVAMVRSGNDGHAVRERPLSLRGAVAFRDI
jgi:hypothetical protein